MCDSEVDDWQALNLNAALGGCEQLKLDNINLIIKCCIRAGEENDVIRSH